MIRMIFIREHERGLVFHRGEWKGVLRPGSHTIMDPLLRTRVDVVSVRTPWLAHEQLDVIARSGALEDEVAFLDLKGHERALVWVDGRFFALLKPGLYALWKVFHDVDVEVVDARSLKLVHDELAQILMDETAPEALVTAPVQSGQVGVLYVNGEIAGTLPPGVHAFWKDAAAIRVQAVDLREQSLDLAGQEIMTKDRVTLRLNAQLAYRVEDPVKALQAATDFAQALYRAAQLTLREAVSGRELDELLAAKGAVAAEIQAALAERAGDLGLRIVSAGIRDVILPGEMKELLNRVTEAKKAAEAALITRREETAAMRSQANTARILESNPTLMRLRELEVLEKIAGQANLQVILGDSGLADRVVKML